MRPITRDQKKTILKLHNQGEPTQTIAERLGVNRETVRRYIVSNDGYQRDKLSTKGKRFWRHD